MYIWERRGLAEVTPATPGRVTPGLRSRPPRLRFFNLDGFETDQHALTGRLKTNVKTLADLVKANLKPSPLITVIHLVGHTDSTGKEAYNLDLGKRRAVAVQNELTGHLSGLMGRVWIIVEPSPGASQPTADNRTAEGRARNRRVEVFLSTRVTPSGPVDPSPPPIDLNKAAQDAAEAAEERRRQEEERRGRVLPGPPPPPVRGRSLSARLREWLEPLGWLGRLIHKAVLEGSCRGLEVLLSRAGARLNDKQKEELRKQCLDFANRPR